MTMIERIVQAHRRILEARADRDKLIAQAVNVEKRAGEKIAQYIARAVGPEHAISGQHVRMIAKKAREQNGSQP